MLPIETLKYKEQQLREKMKKVTITPCSSNVNFVQVEGQSTSLLKPRTFTVSSNAPCWTPIEENSTKKESVVDKAIKLVNTDRQADYGHPAEDFTRATGMLSSLGFRFQNSDGTLRELSAIDIPIIQMCVKLSREVNRHKDDNVVDIIGYAKCLDMVYQYYDDSAKRSTADQSNAG